MFILQYEISAQYEEVYKDFAGYQTIKKPLNSLSNPKIIKDYFHAL